MRKPIALGAERKRKTVGPLFGFLLATPLIANVALAETPVAAATDKRLDPVPPPARLITSWEEALRQFRQNSIEFRSALMEQERLSGVARTTSASLLPTSNATVAFTHQFLTTSGTQISGVDPVTNQPQFAPFTVPQSNILSANVGVQWTPLSLAAWRNKKTAAINVEAAQASSADVERTMLLNLAQAAVAVYTTERIAELNRLGILSRIVRASSPKGGVVLDFFAGSGTTGQAAMEAGRSFILVDENPEAIGVMKKRFKDVRDVEFVVSNVR